MAARGGGAKSGGAPPNLRSFGPKTAIFRPKQPQNPGETPKRRDTVSTLHVRLDFTVSKSSLVPFNFTICPRNGPKRRQKAPKTCAMRTNTPKPSTGRILGYVAQNPIPKAPSPPASPRFLWFPSLRIAQQATQTPVPVVTWWSRRPAHGGGQRWVHQGPQGEKNHFSKVVPRPLGMFREVFLGRFEPVVARFRPWKVPKCLENGPFRDLQCVKNGSKTRFSKSDPGPFRMLKQVVLAHFEPFLTDFSHFHHMYAPL